MVVLACWIALCVAWGLGVMVPRYLSYRYDRKQVERLGSSLAACLECERYALNRGDLKGAAFWAEQAEARSLEAFRLSVRQFALVRA